MNQHARLSDQSLGTLPHHVQRPAYVRADSSVGIVHIGVGHFHRAHQALIIDRLLTQGRATDWAICGVALLPTDEGLARSLQQQSGLYTLVEKSSTGEWDFRVMGSITEILFGPDNPDAVLDRMSDPATKIVSLTITEGGYNIVPTTGDFDLANDDVRRDLANDDTPVTVFGVVTEALRRRRTMGVAPFTVLSCDNIQHNGDVARHAFSSFAAARDAALGQWMRVEVAFPNSMVDRITPGTTAEDVVSVSHELGITDEWPVLCEPFFQWVIEDNFPSGRPEWERAGVQMTSDVAPYEKMKLRLLNASHQGLAYFASLMGYEYVHDAARDPRIATFLRRYMDREATPTLDPVEGVDLDAYKTELIERFANPEVKDTVARLAAETSDRIPKWLLPVIRERLLEDGDIRCSAAIVASWARYAEAVAEDGQPIEVVDPLKDQLVPIAQRQREQPLAFIENRELFGDLVDDERFVDPYLQTLQRLHTDGAEATLEWILHVCSE